MRIPTRCLIAAVLGTVGSVAWGCSGGDQFLRPPGEAQLAKTTSVTVTAASPNYGKQGETSEHVTITGSGFKAGAVAEWDLNGAPDPRIQVVSTTYLSSTQLDVVINIASDAEITFYDVAVTNFDKTKGIGTDLFEVTTAENLGLAGNLPGKPPISEQLQVVGYASSAYVYDDAAGGLVNLGAGQAWAIDPQGALIGGNDGDGFGAVWLEQAPGVYAFQSLPRSTGIKSSRVRSIARASDGTLLLGGTEVAPCPSCKPNASQSDSVRPVVWRGSGTSWTGPQNYVRPPGKGIQGELSDINANGQAVGIRNGETTNPGVIWEDSTTYTLVDGFAFGINAAGTVAVGLRNGTGPVYWWRDPVTHQWHTTGVPLPTLGGGTCGRATMINSAGIVVGASCNADGFAQATVWKLDLSGSAPVVIAMQGLPGLGDKIVNPSSEPVSIAGGITDTPPYVVAGNARSKTVNYWVRWRLY